MVSEKHTEKLNCTQGKPIDRIVCAFSFYNTQKNISLNKEQEIMKLHKGLSWLPIVTIASIFLFTVFTVASADNDGKPFPDPRYAPDEIVRIQLEALQENNIEVTFRFASPANKSQTGPLDRFEEMLSSPAYRPMLGSLTIEYYRLEMSQNYARQRVRLIGRGGEEVVYVFYLSKQSDGPYENCWMTDVVRVESYSGKGSAI
jgi:hypothetical protein